MTQMDYLGVAGAGGGLDISARNFDQLSLLGLASAGKKHGAKLIIRDAATMTQLSRIGLAAASPGNVIFVF